MSKEIISQNLRRIRKSKGFTQAEVADHAGISRPAYRNIETGKSEPKVSTLRDIAEALGVGIQKLLAPVKTLSEVRFRAHKKMTSREQILVDVATWLDNFNMLEELLGKTEQPVKLQALQQELQSYQNEDRPEHAARKAREILLDDKEDNGEPIRNLAGLLEDGGIKVLPYSLASDTEAYPHSRDKLEGFFGLSVGAKDGGPAIVVNVWDRIPVERWIFSMAHELGHLLLHLDSYQVAEAGTEDKKQEEEANRFASEFLMPSAAFWKEWERTKGHHFYDRVMKVKRIYRVSYGTVITRVTEKMVPERRGSVWAMFKKVHQQRTGQILTKAVEPHKLSTVDFMEDRLSRLVREAFCAGKISMGRGAEILGLSLAEMRDRTVSWEYEEDVTG